MGTLAKPSAVVQRLMPRASLVEFETRFDVQVQYPNGWDSTGKAERSYEKAHDAAVALRAVQALPVRIRTLWGRP